MRLKTLAFLAFLAVCCGLLLFLQDESQDEIFKPAKQVEHPLPTVPEAKQVPHKGHPILVPPTLYQFEDIYSEDFNNWDTKQNDWILPVPTMEMFHPDAGPPYNPYATNSNPFTQSTGGGGGGGGGGFARNEEGFTGFFGLTVGGAFAPQVRNGGNGDGEILEPPPDVTEPPPTEPENPGGPIIPEPPPGVKVPEPGTYITLATLLTLIAAVKARKHKMAAARSFMD